jgi:hypothetical protein
MPKCFVFYALTLLGIRFFEPGGQGFESLRAHYCSLVSHVPAQRRGKWDPEIYANRDDTGAPSDEYPQPGAWCRKHGGEAEAETGPEGG